uniref:phage tail tube protein n=1 Tax=Halomonas sp. TaxID=1486246 RepID=UPI00260E8AD9|nr:hypothetical protein [Halomonas sp.]
MLNTRTKILLVAPEAEYGAGADIATATMMLVSELDSSPYEGDRTERTRLREHFGANAEINVAPFTTITSTIPLAGSGTAGTPPNFGLLLRACGLSETIEADTQVTYAPATANPESFCVWFAEDGQVQKVPGVRGNVEFNLTAKQVPTMAFTLTGLYQRPEALSQALSQTLTDIVDELVVNKQNTPVRNVHGHSGCLQSLSLNMGNEVVHRNLVGCEKVLITDRASTGQVEIEAPSITTKNYFEALESHNGITLAPVSIGHGTQAGNIVTITGPKVQLSTLSRADSDGILHYQLGTRYLPDAGDDEFTITFT